MNQYTIKYGDTLSGIAAQTGKSIQEIMKLNPSITDPNKIVAGRTLSLGSGSPTPAVNSQNTQNTNTQKKQTIAEVAKITVPDYVEDTGAFMEMDKVNNQKKESFNRYIDPNTNDLTEAEKQRIYQAQRAALQTQIDAINMSTADMIAKFRKTTARDREGQTYSLAAAGGRVGSATGEAEVRRTEDTNDDEENYYRRDAALKVAALEGQASKAAFEENERRRSSIAKGFDEYIQYSKDAMKQRNQAGLERIKQWIAAGYSLDDVLAKYDSDQKFKNDLLTAYGLDRSGIASIYNNTEQEKKAAEMAANKPFGLSEGQSYFTYNPTTGKYEQIANMPKTYKSETSSGGSGSGSYVPGSNPAVDSWVGQINAGKATISNVPANLKNAVVQALNGATGGVEAPSAVKLEAVSSAKQLLDKFNARKGTSAVGKSGMFGTFGAALIPGTERADFVQQFNNLKSLLSLDNAKLLKGGGAISDAERKLLADAATKLNLSQSEPEFKATLEGIINTMENIQQSPQSGQNNTGAGFQSTSGKTYVLPY
jgi:murein DD-endopeptidase MepM/ murein hydrolase activator NlpD